MIEDGLSVCPKCQRLFSDNTGVTPEKYAHIKIVEAGDIECRACQAEEEAWSTAPEVKTNG